MIYIVKRVMIVMVVTAVVVSAIMDSILKEEIAVCSDGVSCI